MRIPRASKGKKKFVDVCQVDSSLPPSNTPAPPGGGLRSDIQIVKLDATKMMITEKFDR